MTEVMKKSTDYLKEPPKFMLLKPLGGFKRSQSTCVADVGDHSDHIHF
jgi:hypothetical protein